MSRRERHSFAGGEALQGRRERSVLACEKLESQSWRVLCVRAPVKNASPHEEKLANQ